MKKLLALILFVATPSFAQYESGYTARPTLTIQASDPSGACTGAKFVINSTSGDAFACYNGVWNVFGGGGAATFPITATDGSTTVTAVGDPPSQIASFSISDATTGAGWNALSGSPTTSLFAFNATEGALATLDIANQEVKLSYDDGTLPGNPLSHVTLKPTSFRFYNSGPTSPEFQHFIQSFTTNGNMGYIETGIGTQIQIGWQSYGVASMSAQLNGGGGQTSSVVADAFNKRSRMQAVDGSVQATITTEAGEGSALIRGTTDDGTGNVATVIQASNTGWAWSHEIPGGNEANASIYYGGIAHEVIDPTGSASYNMQFGAVNESVTAGTDMSTRAILPTETSMFTNDGTNQSGLEVQALGPRVITNGPKPTCDSTTRGKMWRTEGGIGVADTFEVCRKDAADVYAWVTLF